MTSSALKPRNKHVGLIAGFGVSGISTVVSALALLQGKGASSALFGALAASTAAVTDEVFNSEEAPAPAKPAKPVARKSTRKPSAK